MREGHFVWNNCRLARKSAATRRWLERTGLRGSCKTVLSWKIIINYFDQLTKLESCSCKIFANSIIPCLFTYEREEISIWRPHCIFFQSGLEGISTSATTTTEWPLTWTVSPPASLKRWTNQFHLAILSLWQPGPKSPGGQIWRKSRKNIKKQ